MRSMPSSWKAFCQSINVFDGDVIMIILNNNENKMNAVMQAEKKKKDWE